MLNEYDIVLHDGYEFEIVTNNSKLIQIFVRDTNNNSIGIINRSGNIHLYGQIVPMDVLYDMSAFYRSRFGYRAKNEQYK
jgi:hypothetical protein